MKVKAYGAASATADLKPIEVERREVQPNDVLIDIKYVGICHSDIHHVKGEWGKPPYPAVPGHEIVGIVEEVGNKVTKFKVGDKVGVGCMVDSCGECENCKAGFEQACLKGATMTYGAVDRYGDITYGGYSEKIVVNQDFVLKIPDNLDFAAVAPLLCAGITTYSPLKYWGAGPGKKVAVVGLGGLGHMAVKLAAAMGAEVTVLSRTLNKKEDGLRLGAKHYYATSDPETFEKLKGSFDLIINTISADINVDEYLSLLAFRGALVNVGLPPEPVSLQMFSLVGNNRVYTGSNIGGIPETQEMLDFCGKHNITADIELIDMDYVNKAYERVLNSDVKFRFVMDNSTI